MVFPEGEVLHDERIDEIKLTVACCHIAATISIPNDRNIEVKLSGSPFDGIIRSNVPQPLSEPGDFRFVIMELPVVRDNERRLHFLDPTGQMFLDAV
jgi:hypothetical protein